MKQSTNHYSTAEQSDGQLQISIPTRKRWGLFLFGARSRWGLIIRVNDHRPSTKTARPAIPEAPTPAL